MRKIIYNEVTVSSKDVDESDILSTFTKVYASTPHKKISFLNIYKELPVTNDGNICEFNSTEILFKACPLQLAAIQLSMETIIQAPFLDTPILAKLAYIDIASGLVALKNFSYAEVHFTRRSAVRVRLKVPLNVMIITDSDKITGVIRDISMTGCRVTTPAGYCLEKAGYIAMLFKFFCDGQIIELQIKANLLRITGGPMFECVLLFEHDEKTEKDLSLFIYQRQVEILKELKNCN